MKAFISYSHKDESYLQKLQTALAQIQRQGILQNWTDHNVEAGDRFHQKINDELNASELFIALLSPDYIASNYCYEKEFQQAQQLEKEHKIKIIPVICRPCDWKNTPFAELNALPKNGKPISDWQNEDTAFFNITEMLRFLIQKPTNPSTSMTKQKKDMPRKFEGKYKVRKDFDIVQKSNFIDNTFEEVKTLLKDYLDELATSENVTYKILNDTSNNFRCYLVNRDMGIAQSECVLKKIDEKANPHHFNFNEGDFNAVFVKENREESIGFSLTNDEYEMFFSSRNIMFNVRQDDKRYDAKLIANEIWKKWLTQIGIDIF
jgi:hypothetical protein